jgi:phosphoribosylformimino-5-aminoimidazole carboxamide ribonucleotide (ProFAR) isomerase
MTALNLTELQRLATKTTKPSTNQSMAQWEQRKFKYAQISDSDGCEREVLRMLSVIRHIFYMSGATLEEHILRNP